MAQLKSSGPGARQDQTASEGRPSDDRAPPTQPANRANPRQPSLRIQVPPRPQLAPGVELAGQMQESAFEDPPWLLERKDAGYVQVTELLYRIAEQCTGRQSFDEIATRVSEATGRTVSADNVKQLVGTQLVLKGLVPTADGKLLNSGGPSRSMLALNMRLRMIGPRVIDPIARVLQILFWPPVLIGVLVVAGLAQVWVYFVHGVAGGTRDILYAPALLLIVLFVTAFAAGFHELGHAAALRYGGGRAKGMGAGIYLVYPAFYTDVSDNYRLARWSRVRTDLGGVYFNLLFALALVGLYLLTGQQFLLVIVTLLNLEMVRQLLPLVRLDGYWTLADLTGIPDFFSQMAPFVRRILPGSKDQDRQLPRLKWWGKLVFALYTLIAIPLLGFMLFMLLRGVPTVLATAWDSSWMQASAFAQAQSRGDGLGLLAAVGQLLLLLLPTLGILYTLFRLGRGLIRTIWNWSKPTPTRRWIGGLASLGVVSFLAYLWTPQLPFAAGRPGPLYEYTQANLQPIPPDARGTVFDAVGVPAPSWVPSDAPGQSPAPSPAPALAPSPAPSGDTAPAGGPSPAPLIAPSPAPAAPASAPTAAPTPPASKPTAVTKPAPALPTEPAGTRAPANAPPVAPAKPTAGPPNPPTPAPPPGQRLAP